MKRQRIVSIGTACLIVMISVFLITRSNFADPASTFPQGAIIAWNLKSGTIPAGWVICDGSNGTQDLRKRFLMGVGNFADVGKMVGEFQHQHTFFGQTQNAGNSGDHLAWKADADTSGRTPQATGVTHWHDFSRTTQLADNIPPGYTVLYLMKR